MVQELALFDFDGTLIRGDSIAGFTRFLFGERLLGAPGLLKLLWHTLKWRLGFEKVEQVKSLALAPLKRLNPQQVEALCRKFVETRLLPSLYGDGVKTLTECARQGKTVLLVSASPAVYLWHMAELLPLAAVIATQTDKDYKVTVNVVKGEKVRQIQQWLVEQRINADFENSLAFGDSANDLPMLSMVGKPHLVNPHQKARKRGKSIPVLIWK